VFETKPTLLIASIILGTFIGGFYGALVEAANPNFYVAGYYAALGAIATLWLLAIGEALKEISLTRERKHNKGFPSPRAHLFYHGVPFHFFS